MASAAQQAMINLSTRGAPAGYTELPPGQHWGANPPQQPVSQAPPGGMWGANPPHQSGMWGSNPPRKPDVTTQPVSDMSNPFRSQIAQYGMSKPDAYNPYVAGAKMYGAGRSMPTLGPVDNTGYQERDMQARAKRQALLNQMQQQQQGNYMAANQLGGPQ